MVREKGFQWETERRKYEGNRKICFQRKMCENAFVSISRWIIEPQRQHMQTRVINSSPWGGQTQTHVV